MSHLIIGHVSTTTARIWVRGERKDGDARLRYRPADGSAPWRTESAKLEPHRGHTAVLTLAGLGAATDYECELSYSKGQPPPVRAGRFRTAPAAAGDVSFILGSCNFSKLAIFTSKNVDVAWTRIGALAAASRADFMIHCGDQVYTDLPGIPEPDLPYYQREYQNAWKRRPTAQLLASLPNYMMLDDHEIFDGFSNDAEFLWRPAQPIRDFALEAYRQYQHSHNPQTFPAPALYYAFEFAGVQFFALDVRSERWRKNDPQMIGARQLAEFKNWLAAHAAAPKFVVSSIPFVAEVRDKDDKWCGEPFRSQREEIVDFIAQNAAGRLCFLTGDMHCSYHAELTIAPAGGGSPLTVHELMSSPINQATTGMHAFVDRDERVTAAGTRYRTRPLDAAQFYGAHSNVMLIQFRRAQQRVDWEIYRTKPAQAAELAGSFQF